MTTELKGGGVCAGGGYKYKEQINAEIELHGTEQSRAEQRRAEQRREAAVAAWRGPAYAA